MLGILPLSHDVFESGAVAVLGIIRVSIETVLTATLLPPVV